MLALCAKMDRVWVLVYARGFSALIFPILNSAKPEPKLHICHLDQREGFCALGILSTLKNSHSDSLGACSVLNENRKISDRFVEDFPAKSNIRISAPSTTPIHPLRILPKRF